jgi:hypothetical protein
LLLKSILLLVPLLLVFGGWPVSAAAVDRSDDPETAGSGGISLTAPRRRSRPSVRPTRTAAPPEVDGQLDDAVWKTAARLTTFVQEQPDEGAPATEQTEVYIAHDSAHIYVGLYAHYANPSLVRANHADRDQIGRDDTITVFFDPFLDQQRGYAFTVNGYGVQGDSILNAGSGGGNHGRSGPGDASWNALFDSAGTLVHDGWTAEMAIPFKSLRYPSRRPDEPHQWGFQVQREIQSKNERVVWAPVSRDVIGFLTQMGTLDGMRQLSTSRNLELLPTVTAVGAATLDGDTGQQTQQDVREGGVSVKYGLTSNLTLDFTFNPDFSQIESDEQQIEVNQRFPLFFSERRPFFLEGQEIFDVAGPITAVHTRTVVDPRYGAKITGKIGRTTVGFMFADDQAPGHVEQSDPAFGREATHLIGRLRYDLYRESNIGLIVTDREFMNQYSRLGGIDSRLAIGDSQRLAIRALGSTHRDEQQVTRSGYVFSTNYEKNGHQLEYSGSYFEISPDFRTDSGFVRRTDQRKGQVNVSYRWWPAHWIVNWGPHAEYSRNYQFDGVLQDEALGLEWRTELARNISVNLNTNRNMERYGGIDFHKSRYRVEFNVDTSRFVSLGGSTSWGDQIRYVDAPYLGAGRNGDLRITLHPTSRLETEVNLTTSRFTDTRTNTQEFAVQIYRLLTTYQFTNRLLLRSILDYDNYDHTLGGNLLLTYRVNAGTAFFVGYDGRYQAARHINEALYPGASDYRQTSRALFAKLQVLFRY